MKLLLLGPPGVGKGTQAVRLCAAFGLAHISTGDLLRQNVAEQTEIGKQAKAAMDAGQLVSDAVIINMMREHLQRVNDDYLLDGYPRTIAQADSLRSGNIHLDVVVDLDAADDVIVERLSGRRWHPASGRTYHIVHNPPQREGCDDETGEPLVQRDDDKPDTIANRLAVYREQTSPLKNYYQNYGDNAPRYVQIDGAQEVRAVAEQLLQQLKAGA